MSPSSERASMAVRFYVGHLVTIWGLALSNALHGLALIFTIRDGRHQGWDLTAHWRRMMPLAVPLGVYAILFVVSVAVSMDPATSLSELSDLVSLTTLPLAVMLLRDARGLRRVIDAVLVMIAAVAVYGLVQYHFTDLGALHNRTPGPFSHYQTYAGVLMIGVLIVLARLIAGRGRRQPLHWLGLGLMIWALMGSLTRGPWVGVVVTLTAYVLVRGRRWAVAYVAIGALAFSLIPDAWSSRVASIGDLRDPSNYDRLCMLEAGLFMIEERPLFGLGPGMVRERYPIYRHPTAPRYSVVHLHNTFAQLAAERGLLSLAAYLWLMIAASILAWRLYRRRGGTLGPDGDLDLGALMVIVGFNVAGLFEANWRDTEVQRLMLFVLAWPCITAAGDDAD